MSYIGQQQAQTVSQDSGLLLNANVTSNGIGSQIDTTGYNSIIAEISGNSAFQMTFEGSNDGNFWSTLWTLPVSEAAHVDTIYTNGHYSFDTSTRYVRYNVQQVSSNISLLLYGRSSQSLDSGDRLAIALDPSSNISLSVNVVNLKKDPNGALVISDAPNSYLVPLEAATSNAIFDTTGYNSITVQQILGGASAVTISNDGLNWYGCVGVNMATGAPATALAAGAIFSFPCAARYFRVQGTATAGQIVAYLRTNPITGLPTTSTGMEVNVGTSITGGTVATVTTVGTVSTVTGGGTAVAAAVASNPVTVGAADTSGLVRRFLTTGPVPFGTSNTTFAPANSMGAIVMAGTDQTTIARPLGQITGGKENIPALATMDISQQDGASQIELMALILLELQVLNHQLHQLPLLLNSGINQSPDEPNALRQELSLNNIQN